MTQNESCCLLLRKIFNSQDVFVFLLQKPKEKQVLKVILSIIILLSLLSLMLGVTLKKKKITLATVRILVF